MRNPLARRFSAENAEHFLFREGYGLPPREQFRMLELDLSQLWGHRTPDEAFIVLFSKAAYTILEQPAALKSGAASLRETLWRLIALPAVQYEQAEATVSALVRLLLGCERWRVVRC